MRLLATPQSGAGTMRGEAFPQHSVRRIRPSRLVMHAFLLLLSFLFLAPLILMISASFSSETAISQYGYPLIMGRVDSNAGLQTYLSKLHDAGVEKVMTEIQSQLDKWKSSKG